MSTKRLHADSSGGKYNKRRRSVDYQGTPGSFSMASPTPHATSEDRKHPPELTLETYEHCLQEMEKFVSLTSAAVKMYPSVILQQMRALIAEAQPEISLNADSPERMFADDPQLKIDIDQGNFEGVLNSRTLFARREEPSCVRDLAWPGGLSEKDKRG
ncbi:hypothetical protein K466DRAFT_132917, partial [Polyporus arcularius HHB13444]